VRESSFFRYAQCDRPDVSLAQYRKQIADQDEALSAAFGQTLLNQEIRSLP